MFIQIIGKASENRVIEKCEEKDNTKKKYSSMM